MTVKKGVLKKINKKYIFERQKFNMAIAFILGLVIAILAIAAGIGAGFCFEDDRSIGGTLLVVVCVALVIAFLTVPFSIRTVDTGEIAVVKQLGEAKYTRTAGTHFDFWMTKSYTRYDTKVQNVDVMTSAYSSDAQTMDIAMTLQYQIIEDHVIDIAREYGTLDVLQNRIQSIAIEKTKSVLSSYKAMDIIADRATMSPLVEAAIKEAIGDKYFVTVSTVVLTNIDFSDAFEKAVEDKMIAEQNQLKQEYENTAKINAAEADKQSAIKAQEAKAEADRIAATAKIEIAKSEAEALLTQARAEADALNIQTIQVAKMLGLTEIVDGKEQIKSNLTIEEAQLIKSYIEYVKYMESWDGVLPDTVVGDNAGIILPAN
jgi:regulator of protease activity HflC (stomatin/prohibitin superfamily)